MNYNELKGRVKAAAPCPWVLRPVYMHHSPCPYGTLLFLAGEVGETVLVMFNGGRTRVSEAQVSELMELAQGHRKGECSVSEIKVGDKVRVVQITVREDSYTGVPPAQLRHLGKEGIVTSIAPALVQPYAVILLGDTRTILFSRCELKALSAPCEQQRLDERTSCLREELIRLDKQNKSLREENTRVTNLNKALHKGTVQSRGANAELVVRNRQLAADRSELNETVEGLRKSLAGKRVFIGRLQTRIREIRGTHKQVRSDVLYTINKGLDIR